MEKCGLINCQVVGITRHLVQENSNNFFVAVAEIGDIDILQ